MPRPTSASLRRAALAGGILAGLAVPSAASAANSTAVVLTTDNRISTFETAFPTEATTPVAVTGLETGDKLVGIDVRPQNNALYGLGYNATAQEIRLYAISARTGVATAVNRGATATGAPVPGGIPVTGITATTNFGFDFNPVADRIRVVTDSGYNARLDPNTGKLAGTAADTDITPTSAKIDGAAYTNNQQNAAVTTLYTLSGANGSLYIQNAPNAGVQTAEKPVTVGGQKVPFGATGGFDITPGVNVASNNAAAPANSAGYLATNAGGKAALSLVDLNTGNTLPLGLIGDGNTAVAGLAIQQDAVTDGQPSASLSGTLGTNAKLRRFNTADPLGGTEVAISGLDATDVPVAIDYRPQTGQLYLLAINGNDSKLYLVDPQNPAATPANSATATLVGTANYVNNDGSPLLLPNPATTGYDIDFNPTVDRVRVVTSQGSIPTTGGLNYRINPNNGAAVDGDLGGAAASIGGTNTDGDQNAAATTTGTDVSGTAYTNSFGQSLTGGTTTQYGLSAGKDQLLIQNPPNAGTQTAPLPIKVGGAAFDFSAVRGFDIPSGVRSGASATAATGSGLAILATTATPGGLYAVDLTTGAATLRGVLPGTGTDAPKSLALGDAPPAAKTRTPPVVVPPGTTPGGTTPTTPGGTTPTTPTTPTKPTTPTAAARINLRKVNAKAKRKGRKYTTTGSLSFRKTYTAAEKRKFCAKGTVSIQIRAGKRTISTRRVTLKSNCTFSSAVTFSSTRRFAGRSKLSFAVKFNGTAFVLPRRASTFSVKTR